jgi:uncharacterized protein related to proFAR isomerase
VSASTTTNTDPVEVALKMLEWAAMGLIEEAKELDRLAESGDAVRALEWAEMFPTDVGMQDLEGATKRLRRALPEEVEQ